MVIYVTEIKKQKMKGNVHKYPTQPVTEARDLRCDTLSPLLFNPKQKQTITLQKSKNR